MLKALRSLSFSVRKSWEVGAFYRRERRRAAKLFPRRWLTPGAIIQSDVSQIAADDGGAIVSQDFVDRLATSRKEIVETISRRSLFSLAIGAYLLLVAAGLDLELSIGGFTLKQLPGLNEALLLLTSLVGLSMVPKVANRANIEAALAAAIRATSPPQLQYFYHFAVFSDHLPPMFYPHRVRHIVWGRSKRIAARVYTGLAFLFLVGILLAFVAYRYLVCSMLVSEPSVNATVSWATIAVVLATDAIAWFFFWLFLLPMPHRDWNRLEELQKLRTTDPDAARQREREMYREDVEDSLSMLDKGWMTEEELQSPKRRRQL